MAQAGGGGVLPFDNAASIVLTILIPIIAAVVGYGTNVMAIRMTFWPLRYVGLRCCGRELPGVLGWQVSCLARRASRPFAVPSADPSRPLLLAYPTLQGIVPQRAEEMAQTAVELLSTKLITVQEIFARLDARAFADEAHESLWHISSDLTETVLREVAGDAVAEALPVAARREITSSVMATSHEVTVRLLTELKHRVEEVFDLEAMVVRVLTRDPILLVRTFQRCGEAEFRFLERSGAYFGLVFGLLQMTLWLFYREWWILPAFGLGVGWATNFIAIKLIFRPVEPVQSICWARRCCGRPVTRCCCGRPIQGLFLQRQHEVAAEFADIVANDVVKAAHIIEDLSLGEGADVFRELVAGHVADEHERMLGGILGAAAALAIGEATLGRTKALVADRVFRGVPEMMLANELHMRNAFSIEDTLRDRLRALPSKDFEQVLHPIFEQDEWKLIIVGAIIGGIVGLAQAGLSILADG